MRTGGPLSQCAGVPGLFVQPGDERLDLFLHLWGCRVACDPSLPEPVKGQLAIELHNGSKSPHTEGVGAARRHRHHPSDSLLAKEGGAFNDSAGTPRDRQFAAYGLYVSDLGRANASQKDGPILRPLGGCFLLFCRWRNECWGRRSRRQLCLLRPCYGLYPSACHPYEDGKQACNQESLRHEDGEAGSQYDGLSGVGRETQPVLLCVCHSMPPRGQ